MYVSISSDLVYKYEFFKDTAAFVFSLYVTYTVRD